MRGKSQGFWPQCVSSNLTVGMHASMCPCASEASHTQLTAATPCQIYTSLVVLGEQFCVAFLSPLQLVMVV